MGDPQATEDLARPPRYRSFGAAARADVGRARTMAACGALAFAPVEYALTLWSYSGHIELSSKFRLVALTLTLSLVLALMLAAALAGAMVVARTWSTIFDPAAARREGWFATQPLPAPDAIRPGVPRLWALLATLGVVGLIIQHRTTVLTLNYQEVELRGFYIARDALIAAAIGIVLHRVFAIAASVAARALAPVLGLANPFARWRAAGLAWACLVGGMFVVFWFALPQSRSVLPVRLAIAGCVIALGMGMGAYLHPRLARHPRNHSIAGIAAAAALLLSVMTLWRWGANVETKYVALTASPPLSQLISVVRTANDLDRDGFGSVLGENDCNPFNKNIHPGAQDMPDDGIDQNCDGRDFSLRPTATASGPALPIPDAFKRSDWNILFITIDTVRYDHTSFGGYKEQPAHRDTTPRLAEFVKRSTSFTWCVPPSAGTMASIPAIMTSKFFHSGIALDENLPPGTPPKIKPENTIMPEVMKRAGYHTGVIASHHYWEDWGLDQGVDEYDNSIGKNTDPFLEPADRVTDHVLAWVSRQQGHKWFLWAHYIDPHGRYVAHPDVIDYGTSEPDLYDVELRWTDQQVGRLLDELRRLPSDDHTIIVITSDHGESMGEHTVPVGTHGTALYFELLHVPMIWYIPNLPPKQIGGAVSNLDILPTLAEIVGADTKDLSFEGKSLVPQLFYSKEDHDRIVFAETNAPTPQRAAVSETWKLIYYLQSNIYELYDLKADPSEKTNLAPKDPPAMKLMKTALDSWLERVVYARDAKFNQANERLADLVLATPPKPEVAAQNQSLDDGNISIIGTGVADASPRPAAGSHIDFTVFFHVNKRTELTYKFLVAIWPVNTATWKPTDAAPSNMLAKSAMRATGDGFFATERWRPGENIRDKFGITIPADWTGNGIAVGLVAMDQNGEKAVATGAAPANDPNLIVLGVIPLQGATPPTPPPPSPAPGAGQGSTGSASP